MLQKLTKPSTNKVLYAYYFLMLLFYFGYIILLNYRLNKSEFWSTKSTNNILTQEDVETIIRLGRWTNSFELMFIILFVLMSIIYFVKNRKDRKDLVVVKHYLFGNTFLFIGIIALSYILVRITSLPIGNVLEPLYLPIYIFLGLLGYMLWGLKKSRLGK